MLWQHSKPRPRWLKTDGLIEQWLKERQTLLVLYSKLCGLSPFDDQPANNKTANKVLLQSFCQILIDYVSAGHFELFEKLAEAERQCSSTTTPSSDLLIKILRTTNIALNFNDKHHRLENLDRLTRDLSHLGEQLANRMDWEDLLIREYLKVTNGEKAALSSPRSPSI